ncbi:hypothetical protein LTR37_016053 [Vermiconidia calcicola]|uniref:Uncharacterized protein n=1 Tax=Vermiconidia calcicola TaxID=1690605 RepID=A0ACC3MPC5_9PEZI|nr:hypothetical protein LTR37_016053 [Vermiconidia calcicola]
MDTLDLQPLVEDLASNIDDLEESLAPLLKTALSTSTSKLPLLDKAKLYVLATYAIESILFSSLHLNGVDAKSHPVMRELARVKEYFGKIKTAETAGTKRNVTLDKDAAERFIKADLAGNERYDRERADRVAQEKAGAKRKLEDMAVGTHTRFDESSKRIKAAEAGQESNAATGNEDAEQSAATSTADVGEPEPVDRKKKNRGKPRSEPQKVTLEEEGGDGVEVSKTVHKSSSQAMEALLEGSSSNVEGKKSKKKKRKKNKGQKLEDERAEEMK